MKKWAKKYMSASLLVMMALTICSFGNVKSPSSDYSSSTANVTVTDISIGSKDNAGRYTVKITVKATNLAPDETVKTIGAKWGTVKSNPSNRDSRSSGTSVTFTSPWHTGTTYYVTPFLKTNKTDGEITGSTVSQRTP